MYDLCKQFNHLYKYARSPYDGRQYIGIKTVNDMITPGWTWWYWYDA